MVSFFRKIRFTLLEQNKSLRYLKYAIGEIILITIGILIALQIDSFKTYQNDRVIEKQLLINLKTDLQRDTTDLNRLLQTKNTQIVACGYIIDLFDKPNETIFDFAKYVEGVFAPLAPFIDDNPNRTIFELAKSSGELFTIINDTLKETLTIYFTDNTLSQHLSTTKEYTINNFYIPIEKYPVNVDRWTTKVIQDYLTDYRIESLYLLMYGRFEEEIQLISTKIEQAIQLMEQIDNQILQLNK